MISHRHRCIYVKTPKCASTAVLEWFLAHGGGVHTDRPSWYPGPLEHRIVPTAKAVALYPGYFTFTFMRNPYRRFVSVYSHAERLVRVGAPGQPRGYGSLGEFAELCAELLADTRGLWGREALAFRTGHAGRRYGPLGIPLRELRFLLCHARPQVDFLPDPVSGRLFGVPLGASGGLSHVGAVEQFGDGFGGLRKVLGLPAAPLPRRNASEAAPGALRTLDRDPGLRRLVEAFYAEDFAFAGYPIGRTDGHADGLPRSEPARATRRAGAASVLKRGLLRLAAVEMGIEARLVRTTRLRRALAPLSRLRRRLA